MATHALERKASLFKNLFYLQVSPKQFLKELGKEIKEDNISNGAATLAYYLTLAIFPAAIFVMALLPYLPIAGIDTAIMDLMHKAMPQSAADMFEGVVRDVMSQQRGGLLSFGLLATLWATSTGMYAIMQQLNITYDITEKRNFIRARLVAIGLSLLFTALVIGGFALIIGGSALRDMLAARYELSGALLIAFDAFRWGVVVLGLLLSYALIYYIAPNVKQRFVFITPGSVVGVLILIGASLAFAWYVANFGNYSATYGSIGAVIVLMLWLYIVGLTILFGSELNALIEHHAPQGKEKGEHAEGEKERSPEAAQRTSRAAPGAPFDPNRRGREAADPAAT